jgi:O-antigen ligase
MLTATPYASDRWRGLMPLWLALGAIGCVAAGAGLVAFASQFGTLAPAVAVAVPLLPLAIVAIFADPRLALLILFLSFPVGFQSVRVWEFNLQTADFALLCVAALVFIRRFGSGEPLVRSAWPIAWLLAIAFWALALVPTAAEEGPAIKQAGSFVSGLVVATIVLTVCSTIADVRRVLGALVGVGAAMTVPVVFQSQELRSSFEGALVGGRPEGVFLQPNELGVFCAVVGFCAIALALGAQARWARVASGVAAAVLFGGLMLSLSRAAWLGTAAGVVLLVVALPRLRRGVALFGAVVLCAGFLLGDFAERNPEVSVVTQRVTAFTKLNQPYDDRGAIVSEALNQIEDDPLTGVGPGNFPVASERHVQQERLTVRAVHAHNVYLNAAAELGVPGLLLFLGLTGGIFFAGVHAVRGLSATKERRDRAFVAGLTAALLALFVAELFHVFIGNAILDATVWTLVGALLVCWRDVKARAGAAGDAQATSW